MIDIEREAETQEEGEAGSMPGARRGTRSRDSRIAPWAKGRRQTAEPPRDPPRFLVLMELGVSRPAASSYPSTKMISDYIFSHAVGCLLVLLTVSFVVQKLLILM